MLGLWPAVLSGRQGGRAAAATTPTSTTARSTRPRCTGESQAQAGAGCSGRTVLVGAGRGSHPGEAEARVHGVACTRAGSLMAWLAAHGMAPMAFPRGEPARKGSTR